MSWHVGYVTILVVRVRYKVHRSDTTLLANSELCVIVTRFVSRVSHLQVNKKYEDNYYQIIAIFYFRRIIILPAVLYGFETWSFTFRKCENGVPMTIFGPQRDEVTADWREVQNEELHDLC